MCHDFDGFSWSTYIIISSFSLDISNPRDLIFNWNYCLTSRLHIVYDNDLQRTSSIGKTLDWVEILFLQIWPVKFSHNLTSEWRPILLCTRSSCGIMIQISSYQAIEKCWFYPHIFVQNFLLTVITKDQRDRHGLILPSQIDLCGL